jgi:hypothetical protein
VREALEHHAALQARLEKVQEMDGLLRAAIAPGSEMPSRFARLLQPAAPVVRLRSAWLPAGAAIAAGLAIWMMGTVLTGPAAWLQQTDDGLAIVGPLANAAAATPSGTTLAADNLRIQPVVSFTAANGSLCRDINLRDGDRAARIIACRKAGTGRWIVEAMATVPAQGETTYRPAGAPQSAIVDAALKDLGAKEPMDADEEAAAIARNWAAK